MSPTPPEDLADRLIESMEQLRREQEHVAQTDGDEGILKERFVEIINAWLDGR